MKASALFFTLSFLVGSSGIAAAVCSTSKCTPSPTVQSYYCDAVCTSQGCPTPADVCPGHCRDHPATMCVTNNQCPSGDICFFTGVFGHCSNDPGAVCLNTVQCPSGSCQPNCCVFDTPYAGDGTVTICGSGGADTIYDTPGDDIICGNGGDDVINDSALGGVGGNDIISGGRGNDTITGGPGKDIIHGDQDNDVIIGCGGRDFLSGDDGDDYILTAYAVAGIPCAAQANDHVGSLVCGGKGNDELWGVGPAHQCMDGGPDQAAGGSNHDCVYAYWDQQPDSVGTFKNCANPLGGGPSADSCGCGD